MKRSHNLLKTVKQSLNTINNNNRMNFQTFKQQMLLYLNGDIEERLIHYSLIDYLCFAIQ
jgi:hypothetical protein